MKKRPNVHVSMKKSVECPRLDTRFPVPKLLELAVASTKSPSLAPAMGAVARCVAADAKAWPGSDLVRLLLAVAKAKKVGQRDVCC